MCIPFRRAKTVARNPQTTCVQRCTDTDATSTRCSHTWIKSKLTPSLPLVRMKQNPAINSRLMFQWGAKAMPHNWVCNRDRTITTCNRDRTITTGLRFGLKIKSHKFLWEHFLKLLQNKD